MLRLLAFACLGWILCSSLRAEELISWHEDLGAARQISQQYKVPILIHFYGDQCMPCKALEQNVFTRPEVASTMQRYFVPVRINATRDRRTAAEFGVHSWPTDVFVSPDGKVLAQGVCNQNPNAYLQHLQSVAVMNRDRNAMLAASPTPNPTNSSPTNSNLSGPTQTGPTQPSTPSPYGRTVSNNLQQSAPGRDQAPSPYTNASSGPAPYASLASSPMAINNVNNSPLPSPTFQGQSAGGQAMNGQIGGGPLANNQAMNVLPSQPGTGAANRDPNLPPTVQWQTVSTPQSSAPFAASQSTMGLPAGTNPNALGAASPLASAPTVALPASAQPGQSSAASMPATQTGLAGLPSGSPHTAGSGNTANGYDNPKNAYMSGRPVQGFSSNAPAPQAQANGAGAIVNNPHYPGSAPQPTASHNQPQSLGQLASASSNQRVQAASPSMIDTSKATASVPALSGYCPVALFSQSQWIEGSTQYAIRHRGRIYFLSSEEATKQFLANPDAYSPALSGHDPLVFLREGKLVEGSIYDGVLKDKNRILLFSSEANKKYFFDNYDRLIVELDAITNQSKALTASGPTSVTR